MKRQNVRTLSLVVFTFTYLLIGAAVFDALESDTERRRWEYLKEVRDLIMYKYNITWEDYTVMEVVIIENKPHKAGPQWKFAGAFYFATVVLAMIGYGHSTPVTVGGKAFCMGYAMVGIPLWLVMFQSIGERLNKFASVVIRRAKRILGCARTEATEINLLLATGLLSSAIITTGAAVFSRYEGWSYFDSFYYCFVTLTTIGFGDYVALQNDQALINNPGYVALSLVFILFGLAVVAASINLLVLRFMVMNAEDVRRDEDEAETPTSYTTQALYGEMLNGRLLPASGSGRSGPAGLPPLGALAPLGALGVLGPQAGSGHDAGDQGADQVSVCSCTCLGPTRAARCSHHIPLQYLGPAPRGSASPLVRESSPLVRELRELREVHDPLARRGGQRGSV